MNQNIRNVLIFAAGTIAGGAAVWAVIREKYKQLAAEEIESVKEAYHKKEEPVDDAKEEPVDDAESNNQMTTDGIMERIKQAQDICAKAGYFTSDLVREERKDNNMNNSDMCEPYVIPPEEAGENGYDIVSLTFYSDGVLTDENDEPISNPQQLVGSDFEFHFGEYESDSVFVRNDPMETDYEILADDKEFSKL